MRELFLPLKSILKRDWLRELRTGELLLGGAGFGVVVILSYAFSLPSEYLSGAVGVGALWIAVIFASQIGIARSIGIEGLEGRLDAIRSTGVDPGVYYLGKALSLFLALTVFSFGLMLLTGILFNLAWDIFLKLIPTLILGIAGIALSGPLIALLGAGARSSQVLTPFLYVVLFLPLILSAVMASHSALGGTVFSPAFTVVVAYDLIVGGGVLLVSPVIIEAS